MLNFLQKKLNSDFVQSRTEEFIHRRAERELLKTARVLCGEQGLTPERIEKMARANLRLSDLLAETGWKIPKPTAPTTWAGVNYLKSLSHEQILDILEKGMSGQAGVPRQVAVLRRHPEFARTITEDLKNVTGT